MNNNKDITSSIITIGNEILSGRTQDKNTSALAKWLNKKGILVKEVRIVADNINEIIYHVRDFQRTLGPNTQLTQSAWRTTQSKLCTPADAAVHGFPKGNYSELL